MADQMVSQDGARPTWRAEGRAMPIARNPGADPRHFDGGQEMIKLAGY